MSDSPKFMIQFGEENESAVMLPWWHPFAPPADLSAADAQREYFRRCLAQLSRPMLTAFLEAAFDEMGEFDSNAEIGTAGSERTLKKIFIPAQTDPTNQ